MNNNQRKGKNMAIDCGSGYGGQIGSTCLDTLENFMCKDCEWIWNIKYAVTKEGLN